MVCGKGNQRLGLLGLRDYDVVRQAGSRFVSSIPVDLSVAWVLAFSAHSQRLWV